MSIFILVTQTVLKIMPNQTALISVIVYIRFRTPAFTTHARTDKFQQNTLQRYAGELPLLNTDAMYAGEIQRREKLP